MRENLMREINNQRKESKPMIFLKMQKKCKKCIHTKYTKVYFLISPNLYYFSSIFILNQFKTFEVLSCSLYHLIYCIKKQYKCYSSLMKRTANGQTLTVRLKGIQIYTDCQWQNQNLSSDLQIHCSFNCKQLPICVVFSNSEIVGY